jgi:hypothetical protein
MTTRTHHHKLTWRQALVRIVASVALGTALAAAIASHGVSSSAAGVAPGTPGTAAAELSVLRTGPVERNPPPGVGSGFAGGSADADDVRLLGANVGGLGLNLYASARDNGGACHALSASKGGVGTTCVDSIPAGGITLGASNANGWLLYGFAADGVVAVDVVLDGKPTPATMVANAYLAELGSNDLSAVTELLVHHADGTAVAVSNDLRAPGS